MSTYLQLHSGFQYGEIPLGRDWRHPTLSTTELGFDLQFSERCSGQTLVNPTKIYSSLNCGFFGVEAMKFTMFATKCIKPHYQQRPQRFHSMQLNKNVENLLQLELQDPY